jgi:hypothetical protein
MLVEQEFCGISHDLGKGVRFPSCYSVSQLTAQCACAALMFGLLVLRYYDTHLPQALVTQSALSSGLIRNRCALRRGYRTVAPTREEIALVANIAPADWESQPLGPRGWT